MSLQPYGVPTALDRAVDRAIADENADPQGLPLEDIESLFTPAVRLAFNAAALDKGLPIPFPDLLTPEQHAALEART